MADHRELIRQSLSTCLIETDFSMAQCYRGKVRDTYDFGDYLALVTTDRLSAFDRVLAAVPFKGQVLNQCSAWWFERTAAAVPNHLLAVPHPQVMIAKKCKVFPVELVVRAYITGTTSTALWTQYQHGVRDYCGALFPEGLRKNEQLPTPVLTPTTKEAAHDRPISPMDIVRESLMSAADWEEVAHQALTLFKMGSEIAAAHGLILVDTKYEFGKDADGNILVVDEIHTPDSSRYWRAHSYEERFRAALEPENIDKEFLRLWFTQHSDPYRDAVLPSAPDELIVELSSRYIQLYETITGEVFVPPATDSIISAIELSLKDYFQMV